jgi:hypothetical protein
MAKKKYPVITLCGSTKFRTEFEEVQKKLTLQGNIVISVGLFGHSGDNEVWENMDEGTRTRTKLMLDDMHKEKIKMADSIFVVNPNGYIGSSTWSEICYAWMLKKPIESIEWIDERQIADRVEKHRALAEELAWQQLDAIRHSNGYYMLDDYVHFKHKGKEIVDPWINVETHYDGTPWADHHSPEQGVDPFAYYGKEKVARFIENIIMRNEERIMAQNEMLNHRHELMKQIE